MAWYWHALRALHVFEDRIIEHILRQPGFHRAVSRVHKAVHEARHGRDPSQPMSQGEATRDPEAVKNGLGRTGRFWTLFREEVARQVTGRETALGEDEGAKKKKEKKKEEMGRK
jgi:MIOREX complex component 7